MEEREMTYDEIAQNIYYPVFPELADLIIKETKVKEGKLLDVGCGGGHVGFAVMDKGNFESCTFVDIKDETRKQVLDRSVERGFEGKAKHVVSNVEELPFEDCSFDLAVSRGSMPFWEDQRKAFGEIFRVIKKGGYAFIGCGLGSPEIRKNIKAKMQELGYYKNIKRVKENSKALTNEEYTEFFKDKPCELKIIDNEEQGRWFIIKKLG